MLDPVSLTPARRAGVKAAPISFCAVPASSRPVMTDVWEEVALRRRLKCRQVPATFIEAGLGGGAGVGVSGGVEGGFGDRYLALEAVDLSLAFGGRGGADGFLLLAGKLGLGVIVGGFLAQGLIDRIAAALAGGQRERCGHENEWGDRPIVHRARSIGRCGRRGG